MEKWKDINGYEGYYQVSSYGRVRSLDRLVSNRFIKGSILKQNERGKYLCVCLSKDKMKKSYSVHILVANAFIDNPNNLPCINHKDEIKTNNRVENLEWCTHKYNINYGNAQSRKSNSRMIFKDKKRVDDKIYMKELKHKWYIEHRELYKTKYKQTNNENKYD